MSRKQDIGKRDVEALARALRLQLPKGWVIATGWTLCLERAHELAEHYRQPPLPLPSGATLQVTTWTPPENAGGK